MDADVQASLVKVGTWCCLALSEYWVAACGEEKREKRVNQRANKPVSKKARLVEKQGRAQRTRPSRQVLCWIRFGRIIIFLITAGSLVSHSTADWDQEDIK
jgi:hypothetical protein